MIIRHAHRCLGVLMLSLVLALAPAAHAGSLGKAVLRGATRSLSGNARRSTLAPVLRTDLLRDRRTLARPLRQSRTVFRYTTERQMRRELRAGIPPLRHMTSRAQPGRPPTADHAARRYGLPVKPDVRETIRLRQGHAVRVNRVLAGERGRGEITSPQRVPSSSIRTTVPLR